MDSVHQFRYGVQRPLITREAADEQEQDGRFDYTSLALLELLRRQLERTSSGDAAMPAIAAVLMVNGGLFADAHRQIQATRERVPQAEILTFPGGHLTTSEHPDHLAAAIRDIAARHGVGTTATAHR